MRTRRAGHLRQTLAREAARLMYEEGVTQYFDAKHMAARRILGRRQGRTIRHKPHDLPSNGEIQQALLELAAMVEGSERTRRLFAMRVVALEVMGDLSDFKPRLIGSVSTGHVRRGSDIDLHVFTNDSEDLEQHLWQNGWGFDREMVTIRAGSGFQEFLHLHLDAVFPVELSVYDMRELRIVGRSSTDGKPIRRVSAAHLEARIEEEHPRAWAHYQSTGQIEDLEELLCETRQMTLADLEATMEDDGEPL